MNTKPLLVSLCALLCALLVIAPSCSDESTDNTPNVSSETHWMSTCDDNTPCAEGSVCLCGVCTLPCAVDDDCSATETLSVCTTSGAAFDATCGAAPPQGGICLAACSVGTECASLSDNQSVLACEESLCLLPETCPDSDQDGVTTCAGDCDDTRPEVGPDAEELCDGLDNNCDEEVDEGCVSTGFCQQNDDCNSGLECISFLCLDPNGDEDNDGAINSEDNCIGIPNGDQADSDGNGRGDVCDCIEEACDGVDNDCDGEVDEECTACEVDGDCLVGQICINGFCAVE